MLREKCACVHFASQIHTIYHKISSPLHLSYALHILSKSVADLRLEPCPGSHSELRVSHYRHISTLYFANPRLLIKGQRASKKKMLLSTYSDRTSAEHWKITRALLTGPMLCGGVVKATPRPAFSKIPRLQGFGLSVIATFINSSWAPP